MKRELILFCVIASLCSIILCQEQKQQQQLNLRLIEFNETHREWISEDKVSEMLMECASKGSEKGFMDITNHQNLSVGASLRANPPLPDKPIHQATVDLFIKDLDQVEVRSNIQHYSSYTTRYYTNPLSLEAAQWLAKKYQTYAAHRSDVTVSFFQHTWLEPSIIARIEGSGPNKNEVVILGGHIDSISNGATAPGADDDASGSISVLEVFRVLVQNNFKPSRSIEFHGYAAEEVGLRGSQDIAQSYVNKKVIVAAMLQLDMVGYYKPGTKPMVAVTSDFTSIALNVFLRQLIEAYSTLPVGVNTCGYGCSDHASWNKAGFLAALPAEAPMKDTNPNIHTVNDTLSRINLDHAMEFIKVALGYVVELGLVSK